MGKHTIPGTDWSVEANASFERDEVVRLLRRLPLDPEKIGESGDDDWTLGLLAALCGRGESDANEYVLPIFGRAAEVLLDEIGFGDFGYMQ